MDGVEFLGVLPMEIRRATPKLAVAVQAFENIARPAAGVERVAGATNARDFSGPMAVMCMNDPGFYKSIANEALAKLQSPNVP